MWLFLIVLIIKQRSKNFPRKHLQSPKLREDPPSELLHFVRHLPLFSLLHILPLPVCVLVIQSPQTLWSKSTLNMCSTGPLPGLLRAHQGILYSA